MDFSGFYHEPMSNFCYAVDPTTLHMRLRTGANAASKVTLVVCDTYNWHQLEDGTWAFDGSKCDYITMKCEQTANGFDWWFAEATAPKKRAKYIFIVENDTETYWYGNNFKTSKKDGETIATYEHRCFVYSYIIAEDIFNSPKWVETTVWYQIFPERYAKSNHPGLVKKDLIPWDSLPHVANDHYYGGDIPGIIANLDDIQDMGFTGIYLNPVFKAPSIHKYDTEDFMQIDPAFGDAVLFAQLVDEAHKRGIKIMMDLVYSIIGETHPIWQDVVKNGKSSRYYDCFYFWEDGTYETFGNVPIMPRVNTSHPLIRNHFIEVAVYWARNFGIDAFRLDTANEVSHDFWRAFRKAVRDVNPDIYLLAEVWNDGNPWLRGDQFDAVMNYPITWAIWNYVSGEGNGITFKELASAALVMYPKNRQRAQFNLLGSHDTSRVMSICKGSNKRAMQAFAVLMTLPGSPSCFYGDEIGLEGEGMDDARKCMIWEDNKRNHQLRSFVKKLISLRKEFPEMRHTDVEWVRADEVGVVYKKGQIALILNGQDQDIKMTLPKEWEGRKVRDLLDDRAITVDAALDMEPYGTALWCIE